MPYSDDKSRLEQMLPYLKNLAEGKDAVFRITRGSANTVAFRLRESLRLARIYSQEYPQLAKYAGDYSIKVESASVVRATRRTNVTTFVPGEVLPVAGPPAQVELDPIDAELSRRIGSKMKELEHIRTEAQKELLGSQTPVSIVDAYMRLGPVRPTLNFPEAALDDKELEELWRWADGHTPRLMLMVAEPSVTVALFDPMAAEYSWRPNATETNDE